MLTARLKQCRDYIKGYTEAHAGISPTHDEIRGALGLVSKSGVSRLLDSLEERGHIRRLRHRSRAIEIVSSTCTGFPQRTPAEPVVIGPNARYFVWDSEAKALVAMEGKS